jgi:predicted  nucleic acid-binding Zn-ribbon protein
MAKMSDLNDLFKALATAKATDPKYKQAKKIKKMEEEVKQAVKSDLSDLFAQLATLQEKVEILPEETEGKAEAQQMIAEVMAEPVREEVTPLTPDVERYLTNKTGSVFKQPEENVTEKNIEDVKKKIKYLEQWVGKIAVAGPGSGEVNLRYLDDVDRASIADGLFLKYQASSGKFVFASQVHEEPQVHTVLVNSATYTLNSTDSYVGVNYAGEVTVTLPTGEIGNGRLVYIKDESGLASTNPITVVGTVDNDPSGFILQLDNGSVQLIYREGWRIV